LLFNSFEFIIFLPTVFFLYWFVFNKSIRLQNLLILISSYVFYGWWDWRFLSLIFLSTIIDYFVGLKIYHTQKIDNKKYYLLISILVNLGLLGFFKYFNFFIDSWVHLLNSIGYTHGNTWTLNIILPVGISFYTFQTMSYTLDIFKGKLKPTTDFISFASFVSFFPQLVAGPIERASNLIPQILSRRYFIYDNAVIGLRLILWGLFKKIVIADNIGEYADAIFNNYNLYEGSTLLLGLLFFTFQIYCDFSGYSDIAIGTSKLFGINLKKNFDFPYFSRNIGEFWKRWHISLSSWFRDYIYIPLGGSRGPKRKSIRNIFIIFLVSGLWHGANITFVIWGFAHSILYIPLFLVGNNRKYDDVSFSKIKTNFKELYNIFFTFIAVMVSWVFFRSDTIVDSINYLKIMFGKTLLENPRNDLLQLSIGPDIIIDTIILFLFILIEFIQKDKKSIFDIFSSNTHFIYRWTVYYLVLVTILLRYNDGNNFIYFQF